MPKEDIMWVFQTAILLLDECTPGEIMLNYKINPKYILIARELLTWVKERTEQKNNEELEKD